MKLRLNKIALTVATVSALYSTPALSQTINTVEVLSFGTLAIRDPSSVSEITVNPATNSFSLNSNTYAVRPPQRGEYLVTGGPASSAFTVVTSPATNDLGGPDSQVLTMDNLTVSPGTHTTDGSGEATFYIGGRLRSDGSGDVYSDGTYDDSYNITIAF